MWDKFGFRSVKEREQRSNDAKTNFVHDVDCIIQSDTVDYLILDYCFSDNLLQRLQAIALNDSHFKMIYLEPLCIDDYKTAYLTRNVSNRRHKGHNATTYENGLGTGYHLPDLSIIKTYPILDDTLKIFVSYEPYKQNKSKEEILDFIFSNLL